jgi:hypothetical protein
VTAGEHDDGTRPEILGNDVKIGDQHRRLLFGSQWVRRADEDKRWLGQPTECEQCADVGVVGDDDPVVDCGMVEDLIVWRITQTDIANSHGVVTLSSQ